VILKEGTEDTFGKGQIISNINACAAVVDVIKTTLGKYIVEKLSKTSRKTETPFDAPL
jgi:T-complex protein 1 subunit eta